MAVFMGCDGGEMEVGLALSDTSPPPATVVDHVQQAMLEELMQMTSSSSSSMPSLSIGSPEYSSLIRSMTTTATATEPSSSSSHVRPMQPAVQLPGLLMPPVYGYGGHAPPFVPSSDADDAAMAQAMLAVIASSSSSSAPPPPPPMMAPPPWLTRHRAQAQQQRSSSSPRRGRAGAFKAYSAALSPRARRRPGAPGQRMVKTAIALMVSVHVAMRDRELARRQLEDVGAAAQAQPPPPAQPTSSQVHHMISERRRRERLNESFQTLRALLPPGSKKDKATVLAHTTEYMNKLIAELSDLEEKNRRLEAQLGTTRQAASDDDSSETTVQIVVDVTSGASTSTSTPEQPREVGIRVRVRAECDLSELVIAVLARIREMERFVVATVDAEERGSGHARVSITLRAMVRIILN
ncbi:hypothetical protein PR202_gb27744 [Eleusine coracana subsp. coracana]|uniref:BHLH domain-containing protein n=1 Tax=Eleusine coracana subsp. coracana TaxID=191504 RepID=A0AAV5FSQ6_ELECO|nr:hypothetical protein PR202_gb27744 [Eleusine coracana subsp. coracana]